MCVLRPWAFKVVYQRKAGTYQLGQEEGITADQLVMYVVLKLMTEMRLRKITFLSHFEFLGVYLIILIIPKNRLHNLFLKRKKI